MENTIDKMYFHSIRFSFVITGTIHQYLMNIESTANKRMYLMYTL